MTGTPLPPQTEPGTTPPLAAQFDAPGPRNPLFPIVSDARCGRESCGECHLQRGERCDICGAGQKP